MTDTTRLDPPAATPDRKASRGLWVEGEAATQPSPSARYQPGQVIGSGGLGRVLEARDVWLGRDVAIKELRARDPAAEARFRREAALTSRLQHPSIVPVYDAGAWDNGEAFYAMKRVGGRTLTAEVQAASTADERLGLIRVVAAVADALAYAHSHGVVHRDIKPDNVMVGEFGETVVVDWGVARQADTAEGAAPGIAPDDIAQTAVGTVIGTPAYMSPEQARGEAVDARSDVYAVGALLYYVLAGDAPFRGKSLEEILSNVVRGNAVPLATRAPDVPTALVAIVERAMAPNPAGRYASAALLVRDLRRFETGKLVDAHQYSPLELAARWIGRHRGAVAVGCVATVALLVFGAVSLRSISAEKRAALAARERAEVQAGVAARRADSLTLLQARNALTTDAGAALAWLGQLPLERAAADGRGALVAGAVDVAQRAHAARAPLRVFHRPDGGTVLDAVFSPDGRFVAAAWGANAILLYDRADDSSRVIESDEVHPWRLAFSPDSQTLAVGGMRGAVVLWPSTSGPATVMHSHAGYVDAVAFSADGSQVLSVASDGFRVAPVSARTASRHIVGNGPVGAGDAATDATFVVMAHTSGEVVAHFLATGERRSLGTASAANLLIELTPDNLTAVTVAADGSVTAWPIAGGAPTLLSGAGEVGYHMALSPDGKRVAVARQTIAAQLWDVATGAGIELASASGQILVASFVGDGDALITGGRQGDLRLWHVSSRTHFDLTGHKGAITAVAAAPDGSVALSAGADGSLRVWPTDPIDGGAIAAAGRTLVAMGLAPDRRSVAAFDAAGRMALVRFDGSVPAWRPVHEGAVQDMEYSSDGARIATVGSDRTVRITELAAGTTRVLARTDAQPNAVALADSGTVATRDSRWRVDVWNPDGSHRVQLGGDDWGVNKLRFGPDGQWLALGGTDGRLRIWRVETGEVVVFDGQHPGALRGLHVGRDGEHIATCGSRGDVRLWSVPTGDSREIGGGCVTGGGFAALGDGVIAYPDGDGNLRVVDPKRNELRIVPAGGARGHIAVVDEAHVVTGSVDGAARITNLITGASHPLIRGDGKVLWLGVVHIDGAANVITAGDDGIVRRWRAPLVQEVPAEAVALSAWLFGRTNAVVDYSMP